MANRNYASGGKIYSMHVKPVLLNCAVTIGASGAVTSFRGSMIKSVTRTAAGTYTVTMATSPSPTNFTRIVSTQGAMRSPSTGTSGIVAVEFGFDPSTSMAAKAGGSFSFRTLSTAGTAADAATGSVISILIMADDSSVSVP
jgi:hypothetical protein